LPTPLVSLGELDVLGAALGLGEALRLGALLVVVLFVLVALWPLPIFAPSVVLGAVSARSADVLRFTVARG
jgi:hypothetical protein